MTRENVLGISEESLSVLRTEASRTFFNRAEQGVPFNEAWKKKTTHPSEGGEQSGSLNVRSMAEIELFVAWYREIIDQASGRLAELLAEASAHRMGVLGPEQGQSILKEAETFALSGIAPDVVGPWMAHFLGNGVEPAEPPGFQEMLSNVISELRNCCLIWEAKGKILQAMALYGEKSKIERQRTRADRPPRKILDLSNRFDMSKLTDRQLEVISLRYEYGMSAGAIAKYLRLHRSTIDESLASAKTKIQASGLNERRARKRAETNAGGLD